MSQIQPNIELNSYQLEILKLFTRQMEESDFVEIKRLIVRYLADKVTKMADEKWEAEGWTNDDMEKLLKTHRRTPYNPKN